MTITIFLLSGTELTAPLAELVKVQAALSGNMPVRCNILDQDSIPCEAHFRSSAILGVAVDAATDEKEPWQDTH